MIKIIGGNFKKTKLQVHEKFVRPTSAIKREAIFSILESYAYKKSLNLYSNKAILDLYAGSGSVGLEAISRGMSMGYFFEKETELISILNKNCLKICNKKQFKIINNDAKNLFNTNFSLPISIIFIDPPYKKIDINSILKIVINKKIKNNDTIIVIETHIDENLTIPIKLEIINKKSYGKTTLLFLN